MKRFGTVKIRTTAAAVIVVAIALTIAGVGLVAILHKTMIDNVDSSLELRSIDIAALIEDDTTPAAIAIEGDEDGFVQIVGPAGDVLAESENIEGQSRIAPGRKGTFDLNDSPVDDGAFRVHIRETDSGITIIVGRSLGDIERTIEVVMLSLGLGLPMLVLLLAATTWSVVSRALRPVEAIRAEVADIGGSDLHHRIPEPTTDDEIGRLATTMNAMLDRLEHASDRQQRFVSDASHELRTPLATIRHGLELAKVDPNRDVDALIDSTTEETHRMQYLVDDLLLLARQDQNQAAALGRHTQVDLDDVALVEAHRTRKTQITIDTSALTEAQVLGDAHDLSRIVGNFVDNAVRYATNRVAISVVTTGNQINLHVDDDGPGVAAPDRERIFERFTRADNARSRQTGGAGLGLAIAHELATNHHGSISVSDSPLGGARFTLTLASSTA